MSSLLSSTQQEKYCQDGIVYPVRVLSAEETRRFRGACDDLEAQFGGKPRTVEVRQMHLHFPFAFELATHADYATGAPHGAPYNPPVPPPYANGHGNANANGNGNGYGHAEAAPAGQRPAPAPVDFDDDVDVPPFMKR